MTLYGLSRAAESLSADLKRLGSAKKRARIVVLSGNLGAGKTTFVKAFAKALGIKDRVLSPTFVFVHEYELPRSPFQKLFHVDCYRIESKREFISVGIRDYLRDPKNLVLMEWGEKVRRWTPKPDYTVSLAHHTPRTRKLKIS